ncbi:MAG: hypothetical protein Q7J64_02560 [Elusimicrobiota bacterium]|nr:hypothetical protein [Elusimicrobiota bacterium]
MNDTDYKALRMTQEAVLRLIDEVAKRSRPKDEPEFLFAGEVAKLLRISTWHFYHVYPLLGLVPDRRFGRKLRFKKVQVIQLLAHDPPRRGRPPKRLSVRQTELSLPACPSDEKGGTFTGVRTLG